MKTIWVTGATGFLGSRVAEDLLDRGCAVIASGRQIDLLTRLERKGAQVRPFDLSQAEAVELPSLDAVVHCAAKSSPWGRFEDFYRSNAMGTQSAIQIAKRAGADRFVHISTPSVYFRFQDQYDVTEQQELPSPVNAYAVTKKQSESLVLAADALDPVILRPRGIYGRGDTALLPRLLKAAAHQPLPLMNKGSAVTDLTHVDDVVAAVRAALEVAKDPPQRIFNVSGGVPLNLKHVTEDAGRRAGVAVNWRRVPIWAALAYARSQELMARWQTGYPEPKVTAYGIGLFAYSQTLDISAARQILKWKPQISLEDGLDRTFEGWT